VLPQSIKKAILSADPYRVHAAFVQGANILLTWSNANETYRALETLGFLVVIDIFMTPTAELADIVLPVGTFLEIDMVSESLAGPYVGVTQKVAQVGEAWSIYRVYRGIAQKMGFGQYFPEEKDFLDLLVKPAGITFDEFRRVRVLRGTRQYRSYEKSKFNTPSGKIELYSKKLKGKGFDPLPTYYEPPESPSSDTGLAKEYPFVLTNRKVAPFTHSTGRQITTLRNKQSQPLVYINRGTAKQLTIEDGDSVYIETKRGRIVHTAALEDAIDPRVIITDFGWWFPEKGVAEDIHGARESNINVLTDDKEPFSKEMGSPVLRGILCKVYKTG
jgi:anaerobic selenocysteine-containing dehydrogenase